MTLDIRNPEVLSRVRQAIIDQPWLSVAQAIDQLEQADRDIDTELILAAAQADEAEWKAAGRPGGFEAFTSGTWRDIATEAAADLAHRTLPDGTLIEEAGFGESLAALQEAVPDPFSEGKLSAAAIADIEAHWASTARKDYEANQAAGQNSPRPFGMEG